MKASFVLFSIASADYQCPGSGALIHASMKVTASAAASCSDVEAEITARAGGGSWVDPHNGGIYSLLSSENGVIQTQRTTNPATSVGGTVYTDKQTFVLSDDGAGCKIEACSESQGTSVGDFSTNYCDIRNLYGGSADGYSVVAKDFTHEETSHKGSIGAGHDATKCIVSSLGVSKLPSYCPGSSAGIHANAQITAATASASCDVVKQEIKDRFAGKNGWYDQHNKGTYTEVAATGEATVSATRLTGDGKYTDKINWVLSGSGNTCSIQACSESQVFSIADNSANYCNMKLPICGSDEGCLVANADFSTAGESVTKSTGASSGISNCLKAADMAV